MKLLRVIASVDPSTGGPVAGLRAITPELTKRGFTTEFLTVDDPSAGFLDAMGGSVHACGPARGAYASGAAIRPWLRLHAREFDAVIVHGLWQELGRAVREICLQERRPYFVFPHGMLDPALRAMYPLKHFKKSVYWWLFERRVLGDAKAVFFTCEEERRLAQKSFALYSVNECVVKYGAPGGPPPTARQEHLSAPVSHDRTPYWLFLGRIHSKKGLDLLLPAYARFVSNMSAGERAASPRLVVAGPCDQPSYLARLQGAARALGIADKVDWPGMLSGESKWAALAGAEIFVLPSYQENFGIAVAEALAAGTPVLLSERVNIWREITEDGAGLAEPATEAGTIRLFQRWAAMSAGDKASMRRAARDSFSKRFEIGIAAADFAEKLSTLIRRPDSAA